MTLKNLNCFQIYTAIDDFHIIVGVRSLREDLERGNVEIRILGLNLPPVEIQTQNLRFIVFLEQQ